MPLFASFLSLLFQIAVAFLSYPHPITLPSQQQHGLFGHSSLLPGLPKWHPFLFLSPVALNICTLRKTKEKSVGDS